MEIYEILPGYINVHKMHLTHLIVTRGIIHVYTSAMRMLCRCDASAAKKLSGQCIRLNLDSLVCRHYNAKESKEKES